MMTQAAEDVKVTPPPFLRALDWSAFWVATLISFGVYFYTLAPTVTLEDSGELCTAAAYLGVPHPPGYPIWTIICWLFTKLFAFVTFRGQPNPAFAVNLVSAVFGALATGLAAILVCRSGRDMLRGIRTTTEVIGTTAEDMICWVAGVSSSLIFAFSSVNWSQAVIAEVYSLNAFFLMLVMFLAYVWIRRVDQPLPWLARLIFAIGLFSFLIMVALTGWHIKNYDDFNQVGIHYVVGMLVIFVMMVLGALAWRRWPNARLIYLTALVFGLGLTNYQVLLLLLASLALVLLLKDVRLFRDFMIAGIPFVVLYLLSQNAYLPTPMARSLAAAENRGMGLYKFASVGALLYPLVAAAIALFVPHRKEDGFPVWKQLLLIAIPYVSLGLLAYGGVMIAPPPGSPLNTILPNMAHPADMEGYVYVTLSFVSLALAYFFLPNGAIVAPAILFLELGLLVYAFMPLASETNPPMNWGYPRTWEGFKHAISRGQYEKIAPTAIFSSQFIAQIGDYLRDLRATFTLPIVIVGFLPFAAWGVNLGRERRLRAIYAAVILAVAAVSFVMVEEMLAPTVGEIPALSAVYRTLIALIMLLSLAGGFILLYGEGKELIFNLFGIRRPVSAGPEHEGVTVDLDVDSDSRKWTLVTLSGFAVMSFMLIALASPKGDIQDMFIQRVKFISSHALYALWVGYGIVFGLGFVDTVMRGNVMVKYLGLIAALALPAIPLLDNAYNPELLRINGGAEQNGHDYGWQFGNYQLRGAAAVLEELDPEEEPLPNPSFPGEMGPEAIFFGGTDPGRFVPTYMIYGADVRPDVYLITQNALADNTYMSVMRDLYGDQIWIPSQEDSARSFQRYVDEVRAGKRPKNAELKIEGGRVSVSGALGVMEINGILCEMIFEHNRWKHDFYVEESYVIRWMYPYLTPHGLIMKINPQPTDLAPANVRDDMDFWDWYTRRLCGDEKFIRDVVARKSFSKLRSAIAGLYANRGRFAEAGHAYEEARALYPLSPEANFRLVQEVHFPQRRFTESRTLMEYFYTQDPGNARIFDFVKHIESFEKLYLRIGELEEVRRKGAMDANQALELSSCYLQAQQMGPFMATVAGILANTNLPAPFYYNTALLLHRAQRYAEMDRAIELTVARAAADTPPAMYLDLARLYMEAEMAEKTLGMMRAYLERAPQDWRAWLDAAAMYLAVKQTGQAQRAMEQALRHGGQEAMQIIQQDERFAPLRGRALSRVPSFPGMSF